MKKEKSTFEIFLDVALVGLTLMAIVGIWFLTNIKWWV